MQADALICSHPRSGGRWLRFLVAHYLEARYRLGFELTPESVFSLVPDHHPESKRGYPAFRFGSHRGFPLLAVCHQPYAWELHRHFPVLFLVRNAYDVTVSAFFHLTQEKRDYTGSMRDFIRHPRYGLGSWIEYLNSWSPRLLTHRDAAYVAYGELQHDPGSALRKVLEFIDEPPDPELVHLAVASGQALRETRRIRTGQEGNFWDHLQPEEIFEIQEIIHTGLSEFSRALLKAASVDLDPFPRQDLE
jgi:hypothetical protein